MTVRECTVDGCHRSHPRYPHVDGLVCGTCFDYYRVHGHRPDDRVAVCPFCPGRRRTLTAFRAGTTGGVPRGN